MLSFSFMIISSKFINHLVPLPFCIVFAQPFFQFAGIFLSFSQRHKGILKFSISTHRHIFREPLSRIRNNANAYFSANPKIVQISAISERLYMNYYKCDECNASDRTLSNIHYLLPNDVTLFIFIISKLFHHLIQTFH